MLSYIAFLRGINVGGHKKILMADLRAVLNKEGFVEVKTYIQSGNIIFKSEDFNQRALEQNLHHIIKRNFGFEVAVLVKNKRELYEIFNQCPFADQKKLKSYFILLKNLPDEKGLMELNQEDYQNEEFQIIKNCVYYVYDKGYGKSKFNAAYFERKLKTPATARNYNTLLKLLSMFD